MITRKQQGFGTRLMSPCILLVTLVVLLIHEHCEGSTMEWEDQYKKLYPRTFNVCNDKLVEWNYDPSAGPESPTSFTLDGHSLWYGSGMYMTGKWKPVSSDSSPIVHPSFVSGDKGMFEFYTPDMEGLVEGKKGPRIQTISGDLYLRNTKNRSQVGASVDVAGVYNSDSAEVCFVGCVHKAVLTFPSLLPNAPQGGMQSKTNLTDVGNFFRPTVDDSDEDCIIRGLLTVSRKKKRGRYSTNGTLQSLRLFNETGYFTSIGLDGKLVNNRDQRNLYKWELFIRSTIFAIEVVILMWQVLHSIRSPSSYFVSMLMIVVQIVVMCLLFGHLIYIPLHLLASRRLKYLLSIMALAPWIVMALIILLNVVFLLVILRKRMVAKRLNVVERPREVLLAIICMLIYAATGVAVWSTHNLDTYVQVVWCWFLLPQVIANVFWDLRLKPLHWLYIVGVSLCRIAHIGFNAVRPTIYAVDDFDEFPHSWFWGIAGTVSFFGSYSFLQQYYGGRVFLPQRWFGYKQVASSKGESNHKEQRFGQDGDTMLDL